VGSDPSSKETIFHAPIIWIKTLSQLKTSDTVVCAVILQLGGSILWMDCWQLHLYKAFVKTLWKDNWPIPLQISLYLCSNDWPPLALVTKKNMKRIKQKTKIFMLITRQQFQNLHSQHFATRQMDRRTGPSHIKIWPEMRQNSTEQQQQQNEHHCCNRSIQRSSIVLNWNSGWRSKW
jgi:hypothetical protein